MKAFKNILLTAAAITCLCSCEQESLPNSETNQGVTLTVAQLSGFAEKASTTRAGDIGTPDAGKTTWVANDLILLKISYNDGTNPIPGTSIFTTATYNGTAWTIAADAKNTAGIPAISGNKLNLPITATQTTVTAYYSPGQEWNTPLAPETAENTKLTLKASSIAGMHEHHTTTYTATEVVDKIVLPAWKATSSRLRIASAAAAEGETDPSIRLTIKEFIPEGGTRITTPKSFSLPIDSKNNSYFYGAWSATPNFQAHVDRVYTNAGGTTETIAVFEHTSTTANAANKSYALDTNKDAPPNSKVYTGSSDGLVEGGPFYELNITKKYWVITDEETTIETDNNIKTALKNVYALDPTRRIHLTVLNATTIAEEAFKDCYAVSKYDFYSVTTIGDRAFEGFTQKIFMLNRTPITSFGAYVFGDITEVQINLFLAIEQQKMVWGDIGWIVDEDPVTGGGFFETINFTHNFCGRTKDMTYNFVIRKSPLMPLPDPDRVPI